MKDILDTIQLWSAAVLAGMLAATAFSYAHLLPLPLTVATWLAGGLAMIVATIYTIAGILSAKVGLRTVRGNRDA